MRLASASLPVEWFNITDDINITEVISIQPEPQTTLAPGGNTTEQLGIFTPELLNTLRDFGCLNDCNGNGKCSKGK